MPTTIARPRPTANSVNPLTQPVKARQFLNEALDRDWSGALTRGHDSGSAPYATVIVRDAAGTEMRLTWHTRATGTYRLFSAMRRTPRKDWHDVTLKEAQAALSASRAAGSTFTTPPLAD